MTIILQLMNTFTIPSYSVEREFVQVCIYPLNHNVNNNPIFSDNNKSSKMKNVTNARKKKEKKEKRVICPYEFPWQYSMLLPKYQPSTGLKQEYLYIDI